MSLYVPDLATRGLARRAAVGPSQFVASGRLVTAIRPSQSPLLQSPLSESQLPVPNWRSFNPLRRTRSVPFRAPRAISRATGNRATVPCFRTSLRVAAGCDAPDRAASCGDITNCTRISNKGIIITNSNNKSSQASPFESTPAGRSTPPVARLVPALAVLLSVLLPLPLPSLPPHLAFFPFPSLTAQAAVPLELVTTQSSPPYSSPPSHLALLPSTPLTAQAAVPLDLVVTQSSPPYSSSPEAQSAAATEQHRAGTAPSDLENKAGLESSERAGRGYTLAVAAPFSGASAPLPSDTFDNVPQTLSETDKKPRRIQKPKSAAAEKCLRKCVGTCIRGGAGAPGEGPINIERPIVVFKSEFRSRQYCLVECSEICNLLPDGKSGP